MIDSKAEALQTSSLLDKTAYPPVERFEGESSTVLDDEIRNHAYLLYELRGRTEGHAVEDWLIAEGYLRARRNRANKVIFR